MAQVRAAALKNNLDLKVELVDPLIARQSVEEERAKFESVFFGSLQYRSTEAQGQDDRSRATSYRTGIDGPLPTGGSLTVSVPVNDVDADDFNTSGVSDAAVSVSYIQSLLKGAGIRINTHSIRIADHQKHIVDARTKLGAIRILTEADIAYWRLYAARQELSVRREQYKLAADQLRHAQDKVSTGSAAKIEIVRAEAGLAGRQEDVINAETVLRSRERDIKRIMHRDDLPMNSAAAIITLTEPNPVSLDLDDQVLVESALNSRMEMMEIELLLALDEINIELARNDVLPDVTFDASYSIRSESTAADRAVAHLLGDSFSEFSVGLSARAPLGNKAARARLHQARLEKIKDLETRELWQQLIELEVFETATELRQNWRRIQAAVQGVDAAFNDYRVEQSQFQLGFRTSTDVLFSAARLADAQLRKIRSYVEYEIAQIRLARATGTLLGYGQIQLNQTIIPGK